LKVLECPECGEKKEVDEKVKKIICAECLITGETPLSENGIVEYSIEAFTKLVSAGIDNWETPKDKEAEEKKLVEKFNKLREKESDLLNIKQKLGIAWGKTKKLEGFALLKKGWSQKDIAKELQVNPSTIYRWKTLQKCHKDDGLYHEEEKMHDFDFESLSSKGFENQNLGGSDQKIKYNYSPKTLKIVKKENSGIG